MRRGIILPERTPVLDLPAFDRFARFLKACIGGQVVLQGPAPNASAVGLELESAEQFAGGRVVGRRWIGTQESVEQFGHLARPKSSVVSPREPRNPAFNPALGTGTQILAVELVKTSSG